MTMKFVNFLNTVKILGSDHNMVIDKIRKLTAKIHGWLTDTEGELLYDLAKSCTGNGVIVEIGSWKGKSTIWLATGSKAGNKVRIYAIDPHTGSSEHKKNYTKVRTFGEFKKNIENAEVDDVVIPFVKTSEEVAKYFDEPIELIFMDGAHEYDLVKLDFELWFPKVIDGGIMAFHDTLGYYGPTKLVGELIYKSKYFRNVGFAGSITFAEKVRQNTVKDKLKNRYVLLLHHLYEFAGRLQLPKAIKNIGNKFIKLIQ